MKVIKINKIKQIYLEQYRLELTQTKILQDVVAQSFQDTQNGTITIRYITMNSLY